MVVQRLDGGICAGLVFELEEGVPLLIRSSGEGSLSHVLSGELVLQTCQLLVFVCRSDRQHTAPSDLGLRGVSVHHQIERSQLAKRKHQRFHLRRMVRTENKAGNTRSPLTKFVATQENAQETQATASHLFFCPIRWQATDKDLAWGIFNDL